MILSHHLTNADAYPQFIVSNINKQPCNPLGKIANHKDPENWMALSAAQSTAVLLGDQFKVGFSITKESGIFFLDIDKALQQDGTWPQWVNELCAKFPGCFIEVSQSGRGLHIVGRYTGELPAHRNKNTHKQIELYTHDRFVLFGCLNGYGDWNTDATRALHEIILADFSNETSTTLPQTLPLLLTDEEVLALCKKKTSPGKAFGTVAKFTELYEADEAALAVAYPPQGQGEPFDRSAADLALCNMLAYQTGEREQIERILWNSKLARDKWLEHKTYLPNTIEKSLKGRIVTHSPNQNTNEGNDNCQALCDGMPHEYQDCYYVIAMKATYSIIHATLLNKDVFNMCYTTPFMKSTPYKIFQDHASTTNHIVYQACFKPDYPHGAIIDLEDRSSINVYCPVKVKMKEGDMTIFFDFLDRMLPNKRDQAIILSYAAALVQNPGLKAMWCPVIQGTQGCGKSFLADMIASVVSERYTHRAKSDELENRFSGHWFAKLLMLVEDVNLRHEKLEDVLKPLITSKRYAFEPKGCDIFMGDFPLNFIITANNIDIIKKEEESRRFSFFMCEQQSHADKVRSGLTNAYFDNLSMWRDQGGQEAFAYFLHNFTPSTEFDFSKGCCTAPDTSTTTIVIEANRSEAELLIQEAIDSSRAGFRGGFISGTMLTLLFNEQARRGINLPNNKRSQVLKKLGYEMHVNLVNGRASRVLKPDGNQPTLFVKIGHTNSSIKDKEHIMKTYEDAQK